VRTSPFPAMKGSRQCTAPCAPVSFFTNCHVERLSTRMAPSGPRRGKGARVPCGDGGRNSTLQGGKSVPEAETRTEPLTKVCRCMEPMPQNQEPVQRH